MYAILTYSKLMVKDVLRDFIDAILGIDPKKSFCRKNSRSQILDFDYLLVPFSFGGGDFFHPPPRIDQQMNY